MYRPHSPIDQPRVLIRESGKPANAAVVAAPIQKLCPEYLESSTLAKRNAAQTAEANLARVKLLLSSKWEKGPGAGPWSTII